LVFTSGFPTNILHVFLFASMRATCPVRLSLHDLIVLLTISEEYWSWSSSLCNNFVPLREKYAPQHTVLKHHSATVCSRYVHCFLHAWTSPTKRTECCERVMQPFILRFSSFLYWILQNERSRFGFL
jgi:hypothetical protein